MVRHRHVLWVNMKFQTATQVYQYQIHDSNQPKFLCSASQINVLGLVCSCHAHNVWVHLYAHPWVSTSEHMTQCSTSHLSEAQLTTNCRQVIFPMHLSMLVQIHPFIMKMIARNYFLASSQPFSNYFQSLHIQTVDQDEQACFRDHTSMTKQKATQWGLIMIQLERALWMTQWRSMSNGSAICLLAPPMFFFFFFFFVIVISNVSQVVYLSSILTGLPLPRDAGR